MSISKFALGAAIAALTALPSAPAWSQAQVLPDHGPARVTVLYDAFGKDQNLRKDWGYSALVEIGGKRILFDTGNNAEVFAANAKAKGVDFSTLDFVVQSHRHSDHFAGLAKVLEVNPKVKIYGPKEGFGIYGSSLPSSFYRKAEQLPPEQRYYDGKPPEVLKFGTAWDGANIETVDKTTEIAPGIWLIALVSDAPGTKELKELSLAINTPEGIVLVVGCSHPGIEKIVEAAAAINPKIHYVLGGFHLVTATDEAIAGIVASLRDKWKIENIAPGHCTGEPTFAALRNPSVSVMSMLASAQSSMSASPSAPRRGRSSTRRRSRLPLRPSCVVKRPRSRGAISSSIARKSGRALTHASPQMLKWLRASFRLPEPEARP